ncbi:MAG: aminotransferase class V-fold PLP-dependent enzyme [Gemmatimonadaceae bacterium]
MSYDVGALRAREFPWMDSASAVFLNSASTGPLPRRTVEAVGAFTDLRHMPHRMGDDLLFETLAASRQLVARLINARPTEIALAVNTSYGINLAAAGLPLGPGDVVVVPDGDFPANVYPWLELAPKRGATVRVIPMRDGLTDEAALLASLDDPKVKILAVSWVGFATGYRVDLVAMGRRCRERGVHLVVDAIQGLGPLPLDVRAVQPAILSCGAQKWLLSPWGAGFTYVREDLIPALDPPFVSWMAVKGSDDFRKLLDYDMTWRDDARRFEFITVPFQDFAGMNASLTLLLELGPAAIETHVRALADRVVDWARARDDMRLVTPADAGKRAGIVCVAPPDPEATSQRLRDAGVAHSQREGAMRLAIHCFNTGDDITRALEVIGAR